MAQEWTKTIKKTCGKRRLLIQSVDLSKCYFWLHLQLETQKDHNMREFFFFFSGNKDAANFIVSWQTIYIEMWPTQTQLLAWDSMKCTTFDRSVESQEVPEPTNKCFTIKCVYMFLPLLLFDLFASQLEVSYAQIWWSVQLARPQRGGGSMGQHLFFRNRVANTQRLKVPFLCFFCSKKWKDLAVPCCSCCHPFLAFSPRKKHGDRASHPGQIFFSPTFLVRWKSLCLFFCSGELWSSWTSTTLLPGHESFEKPLNSWQENHLRWEVETKLMIQLVYLTSCGTTGLLKS